MASLEALLKWVVLDLDEEAVVVPVARDQPEENNYLAEEDVFAPTCLWQRSRRCSMCWAEPLPSCRRNLWFEYSHHLCGTNALRLPAFFV